MPGFAEQYAALISLIPIGEINAVTARMLWEMKRVGAVTSMKHRLRLLAEVGLIERKRIPGQVYDTAVYFRKPAQ